MASSGSRVLIYKDQPSRDLWGTRSTDAWYIGPALDQYRLFNWFVPETGGRRLSGSFDLFPQHCLLPKFTPDQHASEVYTELCDSIAVMSKPAKRKLPKKLTQTLQQTVTGGRVAPGQRVDAAPTSEGDQLQRVAEPSLVTTSTNPTNKRNLLAAPRTHMC